MACKQNLDLRCVVISDLSTLRAGAKTRLESRIQTFTPHFVCRYHDRDTHRDVGWTWGVPGFKVRPHLSHLHCAITRRVPRLAFNRWSCALFLLLSFFCSLSVYLSACSFSFSLDLSFSSPPCSVVHTADVAMSQCTHAASLLWYTHTLTLMTCLLPSPNLPRNLRR